MERADLTDRERLLANVELGLGAKKDVGEGSWALGPRFSFELPIADAGDARDASARARLRAELERRRALELEVRAAARLAVDRIEAATDELEILREHHVPAHARLVTELLRTVLNKNPQTTMVLIEEVETDNWGIGGETVTLRRSRGS